MGKPYHLQLLILKWKKEKIIKLKYHDLISRNPIIFKDVGSIKCPKLSEVDNITFDVYYSFLSSLIITPEDYFENLEKKYNVKIPLEAVIETTKFDLVLTDDGIMKNIIEALNFFLVENVKFNIKDERFEIYIYSEDNREKIVGYITKEIYNEVIDVILQRVGVNSKNDSIDLSKVKNKRGLKIFKKIMEERKKFKKAKQTSEKSNEQSLPNIISSIAAYSPNTNYVNVWDLTVYEAQDLFNRLTVIDQYNINSTNISVWGDEKKQFKIGAWHTCLYEDK